MSGAGDAPADAGESIMDTAPCTEHEDGTTFLFTSESVGEGHPDKICDQVSDAIIDAHLKEDPFARVSVDCAAKTGMIFVCGNVTSRAHINYQKVVRNTVKQIGYDSSAKGFDYRTCNVIIAIDEFTPGEDDEHLDVDHERTKAGDQGLMFGYATDETEEVMPLTVVLSHKLNARMAALRRSGELAWARPDSKTQVTVEYRVERGAAVPQRVHTVVISVQHDEKVTLQQLREDLMEKVVKPVIPSRYLDQDTKYLLQPSGRFIIGGPQSDAGLTGRKIIVDTYGGWGAHGGGALSGKDVMMIDRCGSYMARWIALSLVKAGICRRCLVQLSYSIGINDPLSVAVFNYGTSKHSMAQLLRIVHDNFDLRPGMIVKELNLRRPIYQQTACYGHFGRSEFPWEQPKPLKV